MAAPKGREVLSVTAALERVQSTLDAGLGPLWVAGEVFDYRGPHRSGHYYFKLQDERAVMEVKLWAGRARRALQCDLAEGRAVLAYGAFDVYPPRGNLSFILEQVEDRGAGDLARRFEELKKRLRAEGLFEEARKRPLPERPRRVVLITGHPSAAAADVIRTLEEHDAPFRVLLRPTRVQGEGSGADLVAALAEAAHARPDLILLARGGGSLEDLWSFNEEAVVRAVAAAPVPVLCAVGHESDFTLCDFAADERAKTPTAGGVRLLAGWLDARRRVAELGAELADAAWAGAEDARLRLDRAARNLRVQQPGRRLDRMRHAVYESQVRLEGAAHALVGRGLARSLRAARRFSAASPARRLELLRSRLAGLDGRLKSVSPLAVLDRGYALVERVDRPGFLRSAAEAEEGDRIRVRLAAGELEADVAARRLPE